MKTCRHENFIFKQRSRIDESHYYLTKNGGFNGGSLFFMIFNIFVTFMVIKKPPLEPPLLVVSWWKCWKSNPWFKIKFWSLGTFFSYLQYFSVKTARHCTYMIFCQNISDSDTYEQEFWTSNWPIEMNNRNIQKPFEIWIDMIIKITFFVIAYQWRL